MPEILREKLQIVVLGTGEHQYQSMFNYYDSKYPKKVSARIIFNSSLAQQIYAGSDMFLMPSLFEPCGIGQMLAMRYGTLPIVRETGDLRIQLIHIINILEKEMDLVLKTIMHMKCFFVYKRL